MSRRLQILPCYLSLQPDAVGTIPRLSRPQEDVNAVFVAEHIALEESYSSLDFDWSNDLLCDGSIEIDIDVRCIDADE